MNEVKSLEARLEEVCTSDDCKECTLWTNYQAMKYFLATEYYPWIQAQCPWFTDHGEKHINSVINSASQLLQNVPEDSLGCLDLFVLLTAIIWHDVGMVAGRSGHSEQVEGIIKSVRSFCLSDLTMFRLVTNITKAHSSDEGLKKCKSCEDIMCPSGKKTHTLYPKASAAVLRFCDEVSENRTRISIPLLEKVPEANRLYWEFAHAITATRVDPERERVIVTAELQRTAAMREYDCPKEYMKHASNGKIRLIEYLVCRFQKMNNERVYCFPYLTRYANLSSIEVRLQVCDEAECDDYPGITFGEGGFGKTPFPEIEVYEQFFEQYPQLTPAGLVKGTTGTCGGKVQE